MSEDLKPHAPWCRSSHDNAVCVRMTSWPDAPVEVWLYFDRARNSLHVRITRPKLPSVFLDPVDAQALATMLAFVAPSQHTAALGAALQDAAGLTFVPLGHPAVGPAKGAINPWAPQRTGD
jgi:hypothetical protein